MKGERNIAPDMRARQKEQARRNSNVYSKALRVLRDRHSDEFEQIWQELKGDGRSIRRRYGNG